ncbi:hypothetical protein IL308_10840 [Lactococcus lactis]|uniref:Eco57I restriction-modification methylase domain-containing protein n=1 Tax=Lactococcus lactis TaxID=1358 RepID=UPI0019112699|nr:hypothetical protein [Lactococcus lactis]
MENSQLRVLYQETLENVTKKPKQLKAFLTQNSYLHQLPFEEIVQIHGQNQRATLLKTWPEWQALGSVPLKGQPALQSLKEFNNRYSKRNSYFDITQLAHKEIEIETLSLSSEQVEAYLSLNEWDFNSNQSTLTNYLDFLKNVSDTTLKNFDFLNQSEKQIVPLVAQYNLVRTYNLAIDENLVTINNEVFKALQQDNIRIDRVIKIGNNLSTKQVELISEQIGKINLVAQSFLEENYKKELEKFESTSKVEPVVEDKLPAFNPEQIWAMKEIIPTFYSDFPSGVTDDDLVNLVEKMRDELVTDKTLQNSSQVNTYRDFEFSLSDSINEYLIQHHPEQPEIYQFLLNHQPIDFQRVIGKQIYESLSYVERSAEEFQEPSASPEEVKIQAKEVPIPQNITNNSDEYKEMIERGYSQLHDSYMHYQDLKLKGQNVSGAYDTFDFHTDKGEIQLGFNYIGRELGTNDDSKVVFWASTDVDAYSTDPMSTPIRSRVIRTFDEAGQALHFENTSEKNNESVEELAPDNSNFYLDNRALLEKIKKDFNLSEDYTIYENEWEIALQKVSFGGVLNEFVIKFEDGELNISDVADSITNIKNFTTEAEKIIEDFRSGTTEAKIPSNDEVIAEDVLEENIDQEQIIAEVLLRSSNIAEGNFRIQHYFEEHLPQESDFKKYASAFLSTEYGLSGYGGKELSYDTSSKGLKIQRPIELLLSWSNVAERVSKFVREGTYLTDNKINDYQEWLLDEATVNFAESRWPQIIEEKEKQEAAAENGEIDLFETSESIETGLDNNVENKINEITQLSDEELQEQIIDSYGKMIGAEGNGYSPNSFNRWAELRQEEIRRNNLKDVKEISLFDDIEDVAFTEENQTDSTQKPQRAEDTSSFEETTFPHEKIPTDSQLEQASEILSEMLDEIELRKPQILFEWSGGLQRLKLVQMIEQSREALVSLDLQSGQFIPDETFLDTWTLEQKEMLRQRLSEVMDIPYEAKPQLELEAPLNNEPLVDFEFPEDLSEFYPKTPTEKVNANLQAIQLVKQIDVENRGATPAEQDVLAKYVGWGGLANEFFDENRLKFASQRQELKTIVSDKEYQAMRESSLTAYYTDPMIIRNMYKELEENGFKGGRILDPAMGTGNFFSAMPKHLRENSELYGVELDTITGSIAKLLHPQANIKIQGFETVDFNSDSFDVVVGNVPFANFTINDARLKKPYLIHDYFFKKSLNIVRPGGLVSFITSTGTMDKRNSSFRKEIHQEAGLIGAIRLPNTAFKAIAGTDVATDILTLQKGQTRSIGYWEESSEVQDSSGEIIEGVQANQFFSKESSLAVLGTFEVGVVAGICHFCTVEKICEMILMFSLLFYLFPIP